ncbi:MAG TPA: hypothetical protein VFB37_16985 [Steroidobacteraceae bacterium]|nr:hypothetical protein [Steroidobacteraceae bacterium]
MSLVNFSEAAREQRAEWLDMRELCAQWFLESEEAARDILRGIAHEHRRQHSGAMPVVVRHRAVLSDLVGLVQLISAREDLPGEIRAQIQNNFRFTNALALLNRQAEQFVHSDAPPIVDAA